MGLSTKKNALALSFRGTRNLIFALITMLQQSDGSYRRQDRVRVLIAYKQTAGATLNRITNRTSERGNRRCQ